MAKACFRHTKAASPCCFHASHFN